MIQHSSDRVTNGTASRLQTPRRSRVVALLFCLLFLFGTILPTYQSVVSAATKNATLPDALPVTDAKQSVAADVQTSKGNKADNAAISGEALAGPAAKPAKVGSKHSEITSKRTLTTKTFDLGGGRFETRQYLSPVHFKNSEGKLQQIDTSLVEDTNAADSSNFLGGAIAWVKGKTQDISTYKVKANDWQARFASSSDPVGMVRIEADGKKISFSPKGAAKDVTPVISTTAEGIELIRYPDIWKDVDVVYTVKNEMLKEEIILKSNAAATSFAYDLSGASLKKNKDGGFDIEGVKQGFSELSVTLQKAGPTSDKVISQDFKNGVLSITLDKAWLKKQSADQFPAVIDPTWSRTVSWDYSAYKSDGYVCGSNSCYMNAGTLNDNGWKTWRTVYYSDLRALQGKQLLGAGMYLQQANRTYRVGTSESLYYAITHANCRGYNCVDGGTPRPAVWFGFNAWFDLTSLVQNRMNAGDWQPWFILTGEERGYYTMKGFDPDISYYEWTYNSTVPASTITTPGADQTLTDPQVSFQASPVSDGDGDAVSYRFVVSSTEGGTGTVIDSGYSNATQWTVPDGVLQDGSAYSVRVYTKDAYSESASPAVRFKVDMRRGNDKTQSADTLGPVSVDLATGNVATSISSHDTTALGGNLGVSLDYNSPLRSRSGLVGKYYNNTSQSGTPVVTRVDKNISFDWNSGSYSSGQPTDNFSVEWTGYFVAPVAGDYTFGGSNDDTAVIQLGADQQQVYNQGCYSGVCYGSAYHMEQGQVVPIRVLLTEGGGLAYVRLYVKGPVAEQVVPSDWLQTGPRSVAQQNGLVGKYYYDDGSHNLDSTTKQLFLSRTDPLLSLNWGEGSPVPGGPSDHFMVRWSGYLTVPTSGSYQFGTRSDDGSRLSINGNQLVNKWYDDGGTPVWASSVNLTAGTPVPITVDFFENSGAAALFLSVKFGDGSEQIVPSSWLSSRAQVLPDGWSLGIDPDGDLSYDRLYTTSSSATLTDSSGDTHMYSWTGSGYKPPVNEDGQLTRGSDGSYTLIDSDGKTYVFASSGELTNVTLPTDDRKPAALTYSYAGTPARVTRIADGVDPARSAAVYYYGDSQGKCQSPAGFDSEASLTAAGKLYACAVLTNDGRASYFLYNQGNLARVLKPGNEATDYQYDSLGRIVAIRDSLANDAVAASAVTGRTADDSVLTQLSYDALGRAISVKAPAATANATRQEQTIEYLPYAMPFVRYFQPSSPYDHWVTTGSPPAGFVAEQNISASLLLKQLPGTHALYSCKVNWDQFVSTDANCEGQTKIGLIGYAYDAPQADGLTVPVRRCMINGEHFVSHTDNCEGFTTETILGYAIAGNTVYGQTRQHITGDAEPNGYTRQIEWDSTFRTVRDTDVTGKATYQQWDSVKDLLLSTTDATGLKSTTIYNANDLPTDSYGPAPATWYGSDSKPLATYTNQVPHTSTGYDEGIWGPAVAWFDYKDINGGTLSGAPKLHTTGFQSGSTATMALDTTTPPVVKSDSAQGIGFTATGKLVVPATGTYTIGVNNEDALRLYINDTLVVDRWANRNHDVSGTSAQITLTAGAYNRFKLDYGNADNGRLAFALDISGNGIATGTNWTNYLVPDYSLQTSQTVYGAPTTTTASGSTVTTATANLTSKTNYGSNPELGLAQSVTTDSGDSTHLNLTATSTYEPATAPTSYLRQTGSSLPGGTTTAYSYYGPTETRANPCDTTKTYHQGGMLRLKTEPDPDGSGSQTGRTTETVYDDSGKVVATRYNSDAWTCTTYDSRERVLTTTVPAYNAQPARTVTNNYAVDGNPLRTSSSDSSGTITVETDLLGRNVKYTDAKGNATTSTYDSKGHLSQRVSKLGTEDYVYDNVDRLTDQKLNSVTYAHVNYDTFSRITDVTYPNGLKLTLTREPDGTPTAEPRGLGRVIGRTYTRTGVSLSDNVTRALTGDVTSGTELGQTKTYSYDTAGRLTSATVAGNTFTYGYANQDTTCLGKPGIPTGTDLTNAGKDSNRTTQTVNGATTTFCYDQADRLVASSNALYDTPLYDSHGNTTRLGSGASTGSGATLNITPQTTFTYDSSDRNIGMVETKTVNGTLTQTNTTYARDAQGRLTYRHQDTNGANVSNDYYGYTASGDSPDFITDVSGNVTEKYLTLPGDVMVTIRPNRTSAGIQTYSLPNIHGDIFATVDADGKVLGTYQEGPFGEKLTNQANNPWNTLNGASFAYVGQHEKLNEVALATAPVQMGARVYIPGLGRFLSVDPVQGGTPNNYVYVADAVNEFDLSGNFAWKKNTKTAWNIACGNGWWALTCVPGIGWIGKGARAVKVVRTVEAAKAVRAAQVAKNAAKGKAAEEQVFKRLAKQYGESNVSLHGKGSGIKTLQGMRYPDIRVNTPNGKFFVEVKSGGSPYTRLQQAKDSEIYKTRGIPTILFREP